jgi:hypothetical protein
MWELPVFFTRPIHTPFGGLSSTQKARINMDCSDISQIMKTFQRLEVKHECLL